MGFEQPKSKSEGYGFHEEWESLGEIVGVSWSLPALILGGFIGDLIG